MQDDIRAAAAQYFDVNPTIPDDRAFYTARLPSADAAVLELGCGTGRVLLPLAAACGCIHGIDRSPAMLARCLQKLQAAGVLLTKARAELGDITHFALGRRFDLIIAPYRVFQLLETEAQVEGLFRCVRAHLAPGGTCILNVFHPQGSFERVRQEWERVPEVCVWEATVEGERLRCDERRARLDPAAHILYPELIYRRAVGNTWIGEAVLKIPRRCYTPDAFEEVIRAHGFRIVQRWGGVYRGALWRGPRADRAVVRLGGYPPHDPWRLRHPCCASVCGVLQVSPLTGMSNLEGDRRALVLLERCYRRPLSRWPLCWSVVCWTDHALTASALMGSCTLLSVRLHDATRVRTWTGADPLASLCRLFLLALATLLLALLQLPFPL